MKADEVRKIIAILKVIAPDYGALGVNTLKAWIDMSEPLVSRKQFGRLWLQAIAYHVAHRIEMSGTVLIDSDDDGLSISVKERQGVASYSEGDTSISFSSPSSSSSASNAELEQTTYGQQFLSLQSSCIVPIHISGERR